jgi:carbonic anhydrase
MGWSAWVGMASDAPVSTKPNPEECLKRLEEGNGRFLRGESLHPHADKQRLILAGTENQGNHAFATIITCSDSRVPVEMIFDSGIMDLFVIRVAGNVCDVDEAGTIEYGLLHVHTPLLVVLGHTQCGAVTAVCEELRGHHEDLGPNITSLVDNILPAAQTVLKLQPNLEARNLIEKVIEENVFQGIRDLYQCSPPTRDLVQSGKVRVVGGLYDVGTGEVKWLDRDRPTQILHQVLAESVQGK